MPAFPTVLARSAGGIVAVPNVQVTNGAIAGGLASAAESTGRLAASVEQQKEKDARLSTSLADAQLQIKLSKLAMERESSGDPLDNYASWLESATGAAYDEIIAGAKNDYERTYLTMAKSDAIGRAVNRGLDVQEKYVVGKRASDLDTLFGDLQIAATLDPASAPTQAAKFRDALSAVDLPFEVRDKFKDSERKINAAGVAAMIEQNPYAGAGMVDDYLRRGMLDAESALTLRNRASNEIESREAKARAEAARVQAEKTQALASQMGLLSIQINDAANAGDLETLDKARKELTALGGVIGYDKVDGLINAAGDATAKVEVVARENERFAAALATGMTDPANADDRKASEQYYRTALAPSLESLPPDERTAKQVSYAVQGGIIPESMQREINAGLLNGSKETQIYYAGVVDKIRAQNAQLVTQLSPEAQRKSAMIVNYQQLGEEDPSGKATLALNVDPSTKQAREASFQNPDMKKALERFLDSKDVDGEDLTPEVIATFNEQYQAEFLATGDAQNSMEEAWRQASGKFGRTAVATVPDGMRVMASPPEKFFGLPELTPEQNSQWMREQLLSDVHAAMGDSLSEEPVDDRLVLMVHPDRRDPSGKPLYVVAIKDANGELRPIRGKGGKVMAWQPNWDASPAAQREAEDLAKGVDRARRRRRGEMITPSQGADAISAAFGAP